MPFPESGSFYEILGVPSNASHSEIRSAFLKLAQRHHPDLNAGDPRADGRFKQIRRVYEVLSDPIRRAAYDDNPHRFRLSDADITWSDLGPIVTRPVHSPSHAGARRPPRSAGNIYRPRWLHEDQFGRESRILVAGMITAMFAISLMPIILVNSQRQAMKTSGPVTTIPPTPEQHHTSFDTLVPANDPSSALEQVMTSVGNLRTDAKNGEPPRSEASKPTNSDRQATPSDDAKIPPFDLIDEFNIPNAGWPVFSTPNSESNSSGTISPNRDANYDEPLTPSLLVVSPAVEWTAPDQITSNLERRAPPTVDAYSAGLTRLPPLKAPHEADFEWRSTRGTVSMSTPSPSMMTPAMQLPMPWTASPQSLPSRASSSTSIPPGPQMFSASPTPNRWRDALRSSFPALERLSQSKNPHGMMTPVRPLPMSSLTATASHTLPSGSTVVLDPVTAPSATFTTGHRSTYPSSSSPKMDDDYQDWSLSGRVLMRTERSPSPGRLPDRAIQSKMPRHPLPSARPIPPRRGF